MAWNRDSSRSSLSPSSVIENYVEAFELADHDSGASVSEYLPEPEHPQFEVILVELIRVDMERRWETGSPIPVEDYLDQFSLRDNDARRAELAFEDYRLRMRAGESPSREEYGNRFEIDTSDWPSEAGAVDATVVRPSLRMDDSEEALSQAARLYKEYRESNRSQADSSWNDPVGESSEAWQFFRNLHQRDPDSAIRVADAVGQIPEVGTEFLEYRLIEELGQGAFGRGYLAQQGTLANRPVVLKIAPDLYGESRALAQLTHTHIVPIYSIHNAGPFQAVCMPYFGSTTLADVYREVTSRQELPQSGKALISSLKHSSSTANNPSDTAESPEPETVDPTTETEESTARTATTLHALEGMTYVESVLWLGARLAEGLAHAHDRGILHRDLKPANILLTDEGQPMLLDFNLSEDTKAVGESASALGGTLPYMSPEHLEAFRDGSRPVDERSDIYGLGVVLYELLTGHVPFPRYSNLLGHEMIPKMVEDRRTVPGLRQWNKQITPAVESIVQHCLAPDPKRRYSSAHQLGEDLEHQLKNEPLAHAPDPSFLERATKFRRRHPRLTSATSILFGCSLVIVVLAMLLVWRGERLAKFEAIETARAFDEDLHEIRFLLGARTARSNLDSGSKASRDALQRYGVLTRSDWQNGESFRQLPKSEQERVREQIGEVLLFSAHAHVLGAEKLEGSSKRDSLREATRLTELARPCFEGDSPALLLLQEEIERASGRTEQADRLSKRIDSLPPRTARDYSLQAYLLAERGRFRAALGKLKRASELAPSDYNVCYLEGICWDALGRTREAIAAYRTCISLRPDFFAAYFNRGLGYLKSKQYRLAVTDFDKVVELRPSYTDAYIDRALAHQGLGDYPRSERDLTTALAKGTPHTRLYFLRARVRDHLGDEDGAERDRAEGFRHRPTDAPSWVARGLARLPGDPNSALEDFEMATKLDPRSLPALQNKAHVLVKYLKKTQEAVDVSSEAIRLYPEDARPIAGRGVLLARLGQIEKALKDAETAKRLDDSPSNLYQLAGIYALASQTDDTHTNEAFRLLFAALKQGFGFDLLSIDRDLDPLRKDERFRRLLVASRDLRKRR